METVAGTKPHDCLTNHSGQVKHGYYTALNSRAEPEVMNLVPDVTRRLSFTSAKGAVD